MLGYRDFFSLATAWLRKGRYRTDFSVNDALPMGVLVTDLDGKCLYSNAAYQKLSGWAGEALLGSHWSAQVHPDDRQSVLEHWEAALEAHQPYLCESRIQGANSDSVWIRRNIAALGEGHEWQGYVHSVEDMSVFKAEEAVRKAAEDRFYADQQRAQVTLDSIGDAVLSTGIDGRVTYMNVVAETLTGFGRQEAIGQPLSDVFQVVDAVTRKPVVDPAQRAIESDSTVALEINSLLISRDGEELAIEDSAAPIHDRSGAVIGAVIVFHDARLSRETTAKMAHLAQHDPLTGLVNRHAFAEHFEQSLALARRHRTQMAILFIDVDNFKDINDALGHECGDIILAALAIKLLGCLRAADTLCRYGGDEFVVLLSEIAEAGDAFEVADKLREAAVKPMDVKGENIHLRISTGVSIYPEDGDTVDALLHCADTAMYECKAYNKRLFLPLSPESTIRS